LTEQEEQALRRQYIKSNLKRGAGSMTYAARSLAKDPASPLREPTREAILRERSSKHTLPTAVRRACRATDGAVELYRDSDSIALGGIYAPGQLRMVREPDGSLRRLRPGERWSVDDASVNFCVCVPWPWGGDKCSERWGVRVGRYQLLACLDDAEDFCPGWSYTMRGRDSYRAEDVVAMLAGVMRLAYQPELLVVEGGAWQAARTLEFLRAAGIRTVDAKGRPHSKLIESWFNRLWTVLSTRTDGQIGRYRGEMDRENELWMRCQAGSLDPRRVFPSIEQAMDAMTWGIGYLNAERIESKEYGKWVPQEMHEAGLAAVPRPALAGGLEYLAARERHMRTVRRHGMAAAAALSPLGFSRTYVFGGDELLPWNGARVWLHFDPFVHPVAAVVTLAQDYRDTAAGTVISRSLACLNAAPALLEDEAGQFQVRYADGLAEAARAKRLANAVVRRELRAVGLDGRRVAAESTISAPELAETQAGIGSIESPPPVYRATRAELREQIDVEELERFEEAGAMRIA
jgi:hypothetical protein